MKLPRLVLVITLTHGLVADYFVMDPFFFFFAVTNRMSGGYQSAVSIREQPKTSQGSLVLKHLY